MKDLLMIDRNKDGNSPRSSYQKKKKCQTHLDRKFKFENYTKMTHGVGCVCGYRSG